MKTRSKKELTQLVLDNMSKFQSGLCQLTADLIRIDIISYDEYFLLHNYFKKHAPRRKNWFGLYWWTKDDPIPRINFLNERLRKLNCKWYQIFK